MSLEMRNSSSTTFLNFNQWGEIGKDMYDADKLLPLRPIDRIVMMSYNYNDAIDINTLPFSHNNNIDLEVDVMYFDVNENNEHSTLEKEVTFLKNIEENLKIALIAKSNLFLMPTRIEKKSVEGFGISFIEAATYGVASIGGKDGGVSDAINHNKTGLICDGNDLNSIYESVIQFLENEKFIELGQTAKKFSENFYWDKVVKKYLELIN